MLLIKKKKKKKLNFLTGGILDFAPLGRVMGVVYPNFVPLSFEVNPDPSCYQIGSKFCEDTPLENIFIQIQPVVFI